MVVIPAASIMQLSSSLTEYYRGPRFERCVPHGRSFTFGPDWFSKDCSDDAALFYMLSVSYSK